MRKSNYDKFPATAIEGDICSGWQAIRSRLAAAAADKGDNCTITVECYQGVDHEELRRELALLPAAQFVDTATLFRPVQEMRDLTQPWITDDRLFGYRARFSYADFLDSSKVEATRQRLNCAEGLTIVYGHGAATVCPDADITVYADMPRWEIQMRQRRHVISNLGVDNADEMPSKQYKRGYFLDWIVCDNLKKQLFTTIDFWLDTTIACQPQMITGDTMCRGLEKTAHTPFRVVPFFDPAPWGGQWMKEVCGLDPTQSNYGWCFDCVPEENSLYLSVNGTRYEMPSNNLVFYKTRDLLGAPVEARFGQDFPIRFDFLDTMGGGNLSLQVHPTTQYIRDTFGIYYTQDESYYLLDAEEGATVYLALKSGTRPQDMIDALNHAQQTGEAFDAERYVNRWPAKKHDHFLIPAGTIHCSGAGAMVLEISATPSIFTFKLYDWGRLGLDGLPRPINIAHGSHVIQWERDTEFARRELVNCVVPTGEGDGWREERTGLHENEFIETRRQWFTKTVTLHTDGSVNVLNLVEGDEAVVESPSGEFEPFVVHYAETFIVPACVGTYTIRPYGLSEGKECGTIKANVRFHN